MLILLCWTLLEGLLIKTKVLRIIKWSYCNYDQSNLENWLILFGMIRAKDSLNNGFTAVLAGYIAKGSQVGLLRLFALHKKLLCPKIKALAWSEPKIEKRRFYRHFGEIYRQWRANWIFKIILTALEVIVSKNQNSSMIRTKVGKTAVLPPFWRVKSPMAGK